METSEYSVLLIYLSRGHTYHKTLPRVSTGKRVAVNWLH